MTFAKLFGAATLGVAALTLAVAAPALASGRDPHHRRAQKVCHWVRN